MATEHEPLTSQAEMARRTRRSFIVLGAGALATAAGLAWVSRPGEDPDDIPAILRSALRFNERVVRTAVYSPSGLSKTYPASAIGKLRANGDVGLKDDVTPGDWLLHVTPFRSSAPTAKLTLSDLRALPRFEETIDFKCVEGWSTVTQFAGARLSDFIAHFAPGSENAACVGMKTPDEEYYVGIDMPSALHPQTLLAYEMNGAALTPEHGAPLRLMTPVKYGIKNIKRIGSIEFTNARPADYWAERGYDWYAGL